MSPRRYVKTSKNTHAEGENFSEELERKGRYMVGISLVSIKTIGKHDVDRTSEFYFKADAGEARKSRIPNKGCIELRMNQEFIAKSDQFTIWSEFIQFKDGDEKVVRVKVQLRDNDPLIDDRLAEENFEIKCPSKTEYVILQDKKGITKAKLKIFAKKTRF